MDVINTIPYQLITLSIFSFGLIIGSFANVCIHRLPKKESIVTPASRCVSCSVFIRPFDNIPVISYLILGGKCKNCKEKISVIYPIIELITGLLLLIGFFKFGLTFDFFIFTLVAPALVIITVIDFRHQIIPDSITLPGIILGLAAGSYSMGILNSIMGCLLGGGLFYILAVMSNGGMGGGDIKYITAAGALVGWEKVLLIIFIGAFLGSIISIFQMVVFKKSRKSPIAFGPFLSLATLITLFYGNLLIKLYLDTLGQ